MNEFISVFGTALIITSVIGFVIGGICMVVEKTPLKERLMNMFNDQDEE